MIHVSVDIETYSSADIRKTGSYNYTLAEDFDVLLIAYAVDDGPVTVLDLASEPDLISAPDDPAEFMALMARDDVQLHAFNAVFEWAGLNRYRARLGLPEIPISKWRCTMAHAAYCGLAGTLADVAAALDVPDNRRKLSTGAALIRLFCKPQKDGTRLKPAVDAARWLLFKEYNAQDVVAEREIERRLRAWPMPEREQRLWELNARTNAHGVRVDVDLARQAVALGHAEKSALFAEAQRLSGLDNPNSISQLGKWFAQELDLPDGLTDMRKDTLAQLRATGVPSEAANRMLEIRALLGKTSVTKYDAMLAALSPGDDRLRGLLQYYGAARTGRWAGRLVQVQNLPQNHLPALDVAREALRAGDAETLRLLYGELPDTMSQLIRTALIPGDGLHYAIADYSAIEARVIAWLADEVWALDVFRGDGKIYEATAGQMFGVDPARIRKGNPEYALRARGKVATLALGYGGGEPALTAMGALKYGIPESDLPEIKARWRTANPHIVAWWGALDRAANDTMATHQPVTLPHGIRMLRRTEPDGGLDMLCIELPSGRALHYPRPYYAPSARNPGRQSLHYYVRGGIEDTWGGVADTWGGKLAENITQAVARDCLAELLLALDAAGLRCVFHVHDEVIVETDDPEALTRMLAMMSAPIPWAPGLPLRGAGFDAGYYQKD